MHGRLATLGFACTHAAAQVAVALLVAWQKARQFGQRHFVHVALEVDDMLDGRPVVAPAPAVELGVMGSPQADITVTAGQAQQALATHQQQLPTGVDLTLTVQHLHDALAQLTQQLRENTTRQGEIRQQLKQDAENRQQQQALMQEIEKVAQQVEDWGYLNALIGSKEGDKFRKFAQGLTLDNLVWLANNQLTRLHGRYLLQRKASEALELEVVDTWQADAVRDTRTLSGGESFIVSLSLALGLSHMASKNVRVDSLFLDEGFGTLDEEALDTALETLAGLQQDGKLIGVISHVPALKERISTQIQVSPQTGGRSQISGPGCGSVAPV